MDHDSSAECRNDVVANFYTEHCNTMDTKSSTERWQSRSLCTD